VAASRGLADSHRCRAAADARVQQDGRADLTEAEDASRFTEMYQKYRARVFSYAVTTVGRDLAEEITSDVFLIAWQRITDVPEKPLPWLLVTARNVGSNQVHAAIRQRALAAEMAAWIPREQQSGDVADQVAERAALLAARGLQDDSPFTFFSEPGQLRFSGGWKAGDAGMAHCPCSHDDLGRAARHGRCVNL
jgi:hypothetical protein